MSLDLNKYLILYECCQLTKGYSRTLLFDSQRRQIEFLDNELYDIFKNKSRKYKVGDILSKYDTPTRKTIIEYFDYLIENEYAFPCEEEEIPYFPKLDLTWENPAFITNCIIDFEKIPDNLDPYVELISDLDDLGCENIQIRDFYGLPVDFFMSFLPHFDKSIVHRIELLVKFNDSRKRYQELINKFPRINELIIHSADKDSDISTTTTQVAYMTKQKITDESCCGVISSKYFNLELEHYLESNNYNTCLNRKVSVDSKGNIKNCPSLKVSYGSINNTRIKEVVKQKEFSKVWHIKKDRIDDCKICEFRHVCTDCRAYLDDDLSLSKPAKCNYNPYTATYD